MVKIMIELYNIIKKIARSHDHIRVTAFTDHLDPVIISKQLLSLIDPKCIQQINSDQLIAPDRQMYNNNNNFQNQIMPSSGQTYNNNNNNNNNNVMTYNNPNMQMSNQYAPMNNTGMYNNNSNYNMNQVMMQPTQTFSSNAMYNSSTVPTAPYNPTY